MMKRAFITLLAIVAVVFSVVCQNKAITFVSLTMDPQDQAAKLHPKTDVNGDLYALIKVRPACDDLKFSFGPRRHLAWLPRPQPGLRLAL